MTDDLKLLPPPEIIDKSNELTEIPAFKPTPGMILWLNTATELLTDKVTEIAKECKMSRAIWYEWLDKPGFEDWYYSEYKVRRRRIIPALDSIGLQQAKRGNYDFWKDMNKKAGESLDEPKQTGVQINNIIGTKKDEYGF